MPNPYATGNRYDEKPGSNFSENSMMGIIDSKKIFNYLQLLS